MMSNITINKKNLALRQKIAKKYTTHFGSKTKVLPYVDEKAILTWSQYFIRVQNSDEETVNYREAYGMFTCSGILFNHKSLVSRIR